MSIKLFDTVSDYPAANGRRFAGLLRVIATPADWRRGEDGIILPSLDEAAAGALLPDGWTTIRRPYLRTVEQPA